jgi:hypothetical protein
MLPVLNQISPVHVFPDNFFQNHLNSILPPMPRSSMWYLCQNFPIKTVFLFTPSHGTSPSHLTSFDFTILRILGRVQTMKLLMKFPPALCYFLPLGSKTVLSTLFSYRLSSCSSLDMINQVSWPHNMQNYSSVYFNHCVFRQQTRRERVLTEKIKAFFKYNNFSWYEILICFDPKTCHNLKQFISYPCVMICYCLLVMRYEHSYFSLHLLLRPTPSD